MIISRAHSVIFFHNPKVGGTSVRATIERFNDIGFGLWGADPAQTGGRPVDRAHLGIDEFATLYPDLWGECRGFRAFCLYRDPTKRFLSSVGEYSKLHGATDIRFCSEARRTRILFDMIDRLSALGTAESDGLMGEYELTHFKPQWIYWHSTDPAVKVEAFPVEQMGAFIGTIAAQTGTDLTPQTRNVREQLDLPGPVAALASSGMLKRAVANLPGITAVKDHLRRRYAGGSGRGAGKESGFTLDAAQTTAVERFVRSFYAEDFVRWPKSSAAA